MRTWPLFDAAASPARRLASCAAALLVVIVSSARVSAQTSNVPPHHSQAVEMNLLNKANQLMSQSKFAEAFDAATQSLELKERRLGAQAITANDRMWLLNIANRAGKSVPPPKQPPFPTQPPPTKPGGAASSGTKDTTAQGIPVDDTATDYELIHDAQEALRGGNLRQALALADKAVIVFDRSANPNTQINADQLRSLAYIYRAGGKYTEAIALHRRFYDMLTAALGDRHWRVGDRAIEHRELKKETTMRGEALRQVNIVAARSGEVVKMLKAGKYREVIELESDNLSIVRDAVGKDNTRYLGLLSNLAEAYVGTGQYAKAAVMQRELLDISLRVYGRHNPSYVGALSHMYILSERIGDEASALKYAREALELAEHIPDNQDQLASTLHNVGICLINRQQFPDAVAALEKSLKVKGQLGDELTTSIGKTYQALGTAYGQCGKNDKARHYFKKSLACVEKAYGREHQSYIYSLNSLAAFDRNDKNFAAALEQQKLVSELAKKVYGADHPMYAKLHGNLGGLYRAMSRDAEAEPILHEELNTLKRHLETTYNVLSERQQLAARKDMRLSLDGYFSLAASIKPPPERVYDHLLAWKGSVYLRQRDMREFVGDRESARHIAALRSSTQRLASHALNPPAVGNIAEWKRVLDALTIQKEKVEQQLADRTATLRKGIQTTKDKEPIDAKALCQALPAGVAIVDIIEYRGSMPVQPMLYSGQPTQLLAFVLRRDQPIRQVWLGSSDTIQDAVEEWRRAITTLQVRSAAGDEKAPQDVVRERVWAPLEPYLDGISTVLVSPDGPIAQIPFAALPGKNPDKFLIEELAVAVVPVPKLIPTMLKTADDSDAARPAPQNMALLIGGIDFAATPGSQADKLDSASTARAATMSFTALPGTVREIDAIGKMLAAQTKPEQILRLAGAAATEEEFRKSAGQSRFVHLATHGFFESVSTKENTYKNYLADLHPGLMSGVVMAGANWKRSSDLSDDGILTALEVASLDLSAVDLAVLSACETGLGRAAGGEGVLGIQRAFQVAGVRTTVTSLWKVDDNATQALMVEFYKSLMDGRTNKLTALRNAQLAMIERYNTQDGKLQPRGLSVVGKQKPVDSKSSAPFYWGAFVLAGDWR